MIRFDSDLPMSNNATFDLLSLDTQDAEGMLLYRENGLTDEVVETQSSTRRHRSRYDKLWQETVHESDTIDFVQARIRALEAAAIDRRQKPQ
jgi:hypothetical protein